MHEIRLYNVYPRVFSIKESAIDSDVWCTDLVFEKGKSYLVEAGSGRGKSSLLSYLYGYRDDYEGTIRFDDTDIRTMKSSDWRVLRCRSVSLLWQELRLFAELSSIDNILIKSNLSKADVSKVDRWLDMLSITDKKFEPVARLSFGQQQRVAFIRSLMQPFDFIMLDEPISHLDDENSRIMTEILLEEAANNGPGIIITSIGRHPNMDYDKILRL